MHKVIILAIGVMMLSFLYSGVAVSEEMKSTDQVTISGTVNTSNQLTDEKGQTFTLADDEQGMKVKAMAGKKVQVTGTLQEEKGNSVVKVSEYKILPPAATAQEKK